MVETNTGGGSSPFDAKLVASLTEGQQELFRNRTGKSAETFQRAAKVMPR